MQKQITYSHTVDVEVVNDNEEAIVFQISSDEVDLSDVLYVYHKADKRLEVQDENKQLLALSVSQQLDISEAMLADID